MKTLSSTDPDVQTAWKATSAAILGTSEPVIHLDYAVDGGFTVSCGAFEAAIPGRGNSAEAVTLACLMSKYSGYAIAGPSELLWQCRNQRSKS